MISSDIGFVRKCNVCDKRIRDANRAIPCHDCKHLIHRNCSDLQLWQTTDTLEILNEWCCKTCWKSKFPFCDIEDHELIPLTFNSNFNCPCKGNELILEDYRLFDKLKINKLDLKEHEHIFDSDIDNYAEFHTNFDYYTSHDFHKLTKGLKTKEKNSSFSLIHTNIQSLLRNKDSLELLCNELDFDFDVIAVTETWHNQANNALFDDVGLSIPGYQSYIGQKSETKCGGSGFFVSENLKVVKRTNLNKTLKNNECEFDAFWIEIDNQKGSNIILAAVYNHPRKNPTEFLNYLDAILRKIMKENKIILISGDFNIDLLRFDKNIFAEKFVNLMFSNFFQPLILQPSRYVVNMRPTLIDNIFINSVHIRLTSGNLISKVSDHMPNFAIVDLDIDRKRKDDVIKRNIKALDENKFLNDLKSIDFSFVNYSVSTLEEKYYFFHNRFLSVVEACPLGKTVKKTEKTKLKTMDHKRDPKVD